jgi:Uma2 family endonuclease
MQHQEDIPRYTIADYKQWEGDWELIRGYPYAMAPSALKKHQVLGRLFIIELDMALRKSCGDNCNCEVLYELDWIVDNNTIVRPDVMVVCNNSDPDDYIRVSPVLIVEIFSPQTKLKDRNTKFNLYQQQGVKYYILADPDLKSMETFELQHNQYAQINNSQPLTLTRNCTIALNEEEIFGSIK